MDTFNDLPVFIDFAAPSSVVREQDRPSMFPILGNGPPATFVYFANGTRVSLPTDQIISTQDADGYARAGFGGMRFVGLENGKLVFVRVREVLPDDQLSPARSYRMELDPHWVTSVSAAGRPVWPINSPSAAPR